MRCFPSALVPVYLSAAELVVVRANLSQTLLACANKTLHRGPLPTTLAEGTEAPDRRRELQRCCSFALLRLPQLSAATSTLRDVFWAVRSRRHWPATPALALQTRRRRGCDSLRQAVRLRPAALPGSKEGLTREVYGHSVPACSPLF